jgi:hypothetical protein
VRAIVGKGGGGGGGALRWESLVIAACPSLSSTMARLPRCRIADIVANRFICAQSQERARRG